MSKRLPPAAATLLVLAACAEPGTTAPAGSPSAARVAAPAAATTTVVMQNLYSPKGLAFGPEGALYVAETGTGVANGACIPAGDGGGAACWSGTGSVSRYWKGRQERVAEGLPSLAEASGAGPVAGPQDVSFQGRGNMYVTIGLGANPALRAQLGARGLTLGTLVRVQPDGRWDVAADVAALEASADPDGDGADSNPYGVLAEAGRQYVTDAGGNSLLEVRTNGALGLVATFPTVQVPPPPPGTGLPPIPVAQSVPTGLTRGPDGALYVGTLTGFPFAPGRADGLPGGARRGAAGVPRRLHRHHGRGVRARRQPLRAAVRGGLGALGPRLGGARDAGRPAVHGRRRPHRADGDRGRPRRRGLRRQQGRVHRRRRGAARRALRRGLARRPNAAA
jgi:hypothetical protein